MEAQARGGMGDGKEALNKDRAKGEDGGVTVELPENPKVNVLHSKDLEVEISEAKHNDTEDGSQATTELMERVDHLIKETKDVLTHELAEAEEAAGSAINAVAVVPPICQTPRKNAAEEATGIAINTVAAVPTLR